MDCVRLPHTSNLLTRTWVEHIMPIEIFRGNKRANQRVNGKQRDAGVASSWCNVSYQSLQLSETETRAESSRSLGTRQVLLEHIDVTGTNSRENLEEMVARRMLLTPTEFYFPAGRIPSSFAIRRESNRAVESKVEKEKGQRGRASSGTTAFFSPLQRTPGRNWPGLRSRSRCWLLKTHGLGKRIAGFSVNSLGNDKSGQ